jgi:hypothetical protein
MNGKKAFGVLAVAAASSFLGTASAVAMDGGDHGGGDRVDRGDRGDGGGSVVVRCNLSGVNPAVHPEIFGNPATAASYGFGRARDGTWHVRPGCRR